MLKSQIKPGAEYAMLEKRLPGAPLQRIRVLEHIRGNKWRAEWVEPNPGLVHFVESGQLLVTWREHRAFLRDEAKEAAIRKHSQERGYRKNSPVDVAIQEIFDSTGEAFVYDHGVLSGAPDAVERLKTRARLDPEKGSLVAYLDRHGTRHLPFDEALELARKFCEAEPSTVLAQVESTERKWSQEAARPGDELMVQLLNESRPAWALIRQWAGQDAAVAEREKHIRQLERLVWDAVYALQKAGLDMEAARLRRALEGK